MHLTIDELYSLFKQHPVIVTDSRKISSGCLFFALRGENFDGNSFAEQAITAGAAYAVIDNADYEGPKSILVKDVLASLQQLATHHRLQWNFPVIGITGTNGKTTTKELVHAVLSEHFIAHATSGNLNNHIGVPLTILSAPESTNIAIIEMGANHPGEIASLSAIAQPGYGIITNIGKAHLEGFGGFEGVIRTKNELYLHLQSTEGMAFVNGDNPLLMKLSASLNKTLYGTGGSVSAKGSILDIDPFLVVNWLKGTDAITIRTQLTGEYNFENVMAAICIGSYFGVPDEKIKRAIENYKPSNSRSQSFKSDNNTIILDAYNANPTSMLAALDNFSKLKADKKMVILGDMLELGTESPAEHENIIDRVSQAGFDQVILVGPEFQQSSGGKFLAFPNSVKAFEYIREQKYQGYTILVKGSRGIRMEEVLTAL